MLQTITLIPCAPNFSDDLGGPWPRRARSKHTTRVSGGNHVLFDIARHYRTRADQSAPANSHARHHESSRSHKGVLTDAYLGDYQRQSGHIKIMATGTEVSLLRNNGPRPDLDFTQGVRVRAVSEQGFIVHGEIPGNRNSCPLVNEWRAVD